MVENIKKNLNDLVRWKEYKGETPSKYHEKKSNRNTF